MLAPSPVDIPKAAPARAHQGRLFRKYLLVILVPVTVILLASGWISFDFSSTEIKSGIAGLQHEKAMAAASRIEQYIRQISQQLAYAALPQVDAGDVELRRIEFLKLLRQAPEVTDIAQLDAAGRETIAVSRLGMDVINSGKDRSQEPAFRNAKRGQPWHGPVYFRKETEPYMTIAMRSGSDAGPVTVADVNLKFIWDVVSRIKIGDKGKAYVVDGNGFLIADPDIGLVLRKTDLSHLPHVKAARAKPDSADLAMLSVDLAGTPVLTSIAPIESLDWMVFVEQPEGTAYQKLNTWVRNTQLLLLAGLVVSAIGALWLARGMVRPIRTLDEGARRIGAGDLDQQIVVRTGDELEGLADQFNRMTAQLRESYAGLERKVDERTRELTTSLEQQTAISEILRVISGSPTDVRPMLNAIAERALRLCDAAESGILLIEGDKLRFACGYGTMPIFEEGELLTLSRKLVVGRSIIDGVTLHHADLVPLLDTEYPDAREHQARFGFRAILTVPLMREQSAIGAIILWRPEAKAFTDKQVALVKTFADQAALAIENVRLFNETKEALEQQTAISGILRVISSSPTDVQPVLEAIAEHAARLCDASVASMYLTDGDILRLLASKGPTPDLVRNVDVVPITPDSLSGRAVLEQRTIQVPDLLEASADYPLSHDIAAQFGHRTVLVTPLYREGKPFGTILLRRHDVRPFSEREIALLRTFADQAAIALENVRLFNETKEALDQQTAISEILRVISNSPTDVQPVLDAVAERALNLCDAAHAVIGLVEGTNLRFVAGFGSAQDAVGEVVPLDRGLVAGRAIVDRTPIHIDDLAQVSDDDYPGARKMQARIGHHSVLAVPLMREDHAIGVIALWRMDVRPFSDKETWLVKTFADQAGIAIDNVRLFREIQDKSRELETANKHKSEFLANMSHELRTPLNAIIGFSEVLLERLFGELNAKQDDYLKDIHSSGRHLLQLINDILDLSKVEAGRMELDATPFDVPAAIANAMTLIRERAQKHDITLALDADPSLGEITADERKFKQILLNLLSNAVKFTPDGGRIEVSARAAQDNVVVAVHDTGIGIAPEDQEAVFEEFRQVGSNYTSKQEGTGLGLALTRKFVELHGGRIWLESEPGKGATFTFTIPSKR